MKEKHLVRFGGINTHLGHSTTDLQTDLQSILVMTQKYVCVFVGDTVVMACQICHITQEHRRLTQEDRPHI